MEKFKNDIKKLDAVNIDIRECISFIPNPVSIEIYSENSAFQTCHFDPRGANTIYYQIIITDIARKELWLECMDKTLLSSLYSQKSISRFLEALGIEIKDKVLLDNAKQWLETCPRWFMD